MVSADIARSFRRWVLDDEGNVKDELIDWAWETEPDENGYYVRLYVDWTEDDEEKRLDTFVELRKGEDMLEHSSCYGYSEWDITNEIMYVTGFYERR